MTRVTETYNEACVFNLVKIKIFLLGINGSDGLTDKIYRQNMVKLYCNYLNNYYTTYVGTCILLAILSFFTDAVLLDLIQFLVILYLL